MNEDSLTPEERQKLKELLEQREKKAADPVLCKALEDIPSEYLDVETD